MKLVFIVANLLGGGVQRVVCNLACTAWERGHNVEVVSLTKLTAAHLNFDAVPVKVFQNKTISAATIKLYSYLRKLDPDTIIITGQPHVNITTIALKKFSGSKARLFISEHNPISISVTKKERLIQHIKWPFYRKSDGIICVSKDITKSIIEGHNFPSSFLATIYNPVEPPKNVNTVIKNKLSEKPYVISCIGRLHAQKNFALAIRTAQALIERGENIFLQIIGEGNERAELEKMAHQLLPSDRYCFKGFVKDIYGALEQTDCLLVTSKWEGFGIVIVEALYSGVNVVSTNCPGPFEILDGGKFGWIADATPLDLSRAIKDAMKTPIDPNFLKQRASDISDPNAVFDKYLKFVSSND